MFLILIHKIVIDISLLQFRVIYIYQHPRSYSQYQPLIHFKATLAEYARNVIEEDPMESKRGNTSVD